MIPFLFNENQFSFFVRHLLVGQLCTNPKSNRGLLSCLKVTQCSTSEIRDAPLYNSCSLPIQVMTTGPLPVPSKCISGQFNAWGHSSTHQTTLWRLWSGRPHHATSHLRSRLESQHQSVPGCVEECGDPLVQSGGQWQDSAPVHKSKEFQAWLQKECYNFEPFSHPPPPSTWTCWTTSFGHTLRTSPTWPPTTPKLASSLPSAELLLALVVKACSSSGSISRWWLRLKAATLNRCQLYNIIKLPELIFFNKSFKINL